MHREKLCLSLAVLTMVASASLASISVSSHGTWPASWTKELEPYRAQAVTVEVGTFHTDYWEKGHEITFTQREYFENAWPHILSVKSKGASIILEQGPSTRWATAVPAGVRILCPTDGAYRDKEGKDLIAGPPYPDHLRSETGVMPEYVIGRDGEYAAFDGNYGDDQNAFILRARVDIVLIVDGNIVDLNRIHLPADTSIIDNRFNRKTYSTVNVINTDASKLHYVQSGSHPHAQRKPSATKNNVLPRAETVRARHILLATGNMGEAEAAKRRAAAEQIRKKLIEGEDFADLAAQYSDCPSSRKGGDLDTFGRRRMVKPFDEAAFSQEEGAIGPIVETQFGYHIIQVTERH